jgi:thioester reductase-like protein
MTGELFLTGVTGYIGSSLLQKWLDSTDVKIHLLVRSRHEERPHSRIQRVLGELYPDTDMARFSRRIEIVEGDVSVPHFGLREKEYEKFGKKISHIIHCAAAARFDLALEDARKTNVGGTVNVLDFARTCRGLDRVDYIGTAYVAGRRRGIVKEDELDTGQQHNNTYERSKFEAEKIIRENMGELPLTIHRLSIVMCDSKSGRASAYNGFYRVLRMYSLGWLNMLPGSPSSLLDLVPVDYVSDTAYSLSTHEMSIGKCYHLTAGLDRITTLGEIRDLAAHHFGRDCFALIPPEEFNAYVSKMENKLSQEERDRIDEIRLYMPYMSSELKFDNSNTIGATGIEAPEVSSYFGRMAEYIKKQNAKRDI